MRQNDPFERLFESLPSIEAPRGFRQRLYARLSEEPLAEKSNALRISGMLCIASALTMFLVLHSPLMSLIPQAIDALKGVLP